ncbi:MAG: YeeE/YedE thiosulfate transporter family protein [Caldimicrobium sp.]
MIGLKYQIWETERFPSKGGINIYLRKLSIFAGLIVFLIFIWKGLGYFLDSNKENAIKGWIFILSILAGFIFHKSKLCMAKVLREPFISGESSMTRAFTLSLFIAVLGIIYLKFAKVLDPHFYILPTFMVISLIGGILFGLGMVWADSCALSMLWKLGEGQIKLLIVGISFILVNSVTDKYINKVQERLEENFVKNIFLPEYLTYKGAVFLIIGVIFVCLIFTEWSKKSKRFVIKI